MKKLLCAISCLCLVALSLCGCRKKEQDEKKNTGRETKLTVYWWGNQARNERTQKVLSMFTAEHPGITFDPQFAEWADYWNKLATSAAGHQMPDVIQMSYTYLNQYAEKNLLVDLTPYIQDGTIDTSNINNSILRTGMINDKLYAVVAGVNAPALLYNKTVLDSHGITVKDNMTLDEFTKLCREIYKKTGYKTNVTYGVGDVFIDYTMRGIGKKLFNGNKFGVDTPADFELFFTIYEQGIKEGWLISPSIFAERTIGSVEQDPMIYGTKPDSMSWCAMVWSNQMNAFCKSASEDMSIGITTWPAVNPVKADFLQPGMFFSVSTDSKDQKTAAALINYITNSIECNRELLAERGIPPNGIVADAIAPQLDPTQQIVINYINKTVTPNCSPVSAPVPAAAAQIFNLVNSLEEQICYKTITSKQAAQELFTKGNEILAK
jgi:multiple sugar transport system substrate-binding protein